MTEAQRTRFASALVRVAGDEETLRMLAGITCEDAPGMVERLRVTLREENASEAAQIAHALKGMLSAFETGEPVDELQVVIDAARANDTETARDVFSANESKIGKLLTEIQSVSSVSA